MKTNDDFPWFSPPLLFSPYFPTNPSSAKVGFLRRYKLFFVRVFSRYKVYCSCAREQHRGHAGTLLPIFEQHFCIFRHIFPSNYLPDPPMADELVKSSVQYHQLISGEMKEEVLNFSEHLKTLKTIKNSQRTNKIKIVKKS